MFFCLNSSSTIIGARPYFTLYINIAISCSLRFNNEGSSARTRRFSYVSERELNTALSARSWIRSIFLLSEDLQLCHTKWHNWPHIIHFYGFGTEILYYKAGSSFTCASCSLKLPNKDLRTRSTNRSAEHILSQSYQVSTFYNAPTTTRFPRFSKSWKNVEDKGPNSIAVQL